MYSFLKLTRNILLLFFILTACNIENRQEHDYIKISISEQGFLQWKDYLYNKALDKGYNRYFLQELFNNINFSKQTLIQDKKQFKKQSFTQYYHNAVNNLRIKKARKKLKKYYQLLDKIESQYQVPKSYIIALWAVESNFGAGMGDFNIINSLANLAYEGRRRKFFEREFFAALDILVQENITIKKFKGSWAGAMGQCQFMPTTYLEYAVDYNNDGKKDIWHNKADIFASIANYLHKYKWQIDIPWGYEVSADKKLSHLVNDKPYRLSYLVQEYNLIKLNHKEKKFSKVELEANVNIINYDNRYFMVFNNFAVIKKWNNSSYFALTIGLLAEQIY